MQGRDRHSSIGKEIMHLAVDQLVLLLQSVQDGIDAASIAGFEDLCDHILIGHADQAGGLLETGSQLVQGPGVESLRRDLAGNVPRDLGCQVESLCAVQGHDETRLTDLLQHGADLASDGRVSGVDRCENRPRRRSLRVAQQRGEGKAKVRLPRPVPCDRQGERLVFQAIAATDDGAGKSCRVLNPRALLRLSDPMVCRSVEHEGLGGRNRKLRFGLKPVDIDGALEQLVAAKRNYLL